MITIGLVGGVASGKSRIAKDFETLGACVLNGDSVGHDVLGFEHVKRAIIQRWGDRVVNRGGELNRPVIAEIVFGREGPEAARELAFLESVTHPEIERILAERITQIDQSGKFPVVVLDAAVLLKAGWDRLCDHILFVDVPRHLRLQRARLRGLSEEQFAAREAAQMPLEQKKERADMVIDNSGPPEETFEHVQKVWRSWVEIA